MNNREKIFKILEKNREEKSDSSKLFEIAREEDLIACLIYSLSINNIYKLKLLAQPEFFQRSKKFKNKELLIDEVIEEANKAGSAAVDCLLVWPDFVDGYFAYLLKKSLIKEAGSTQDEKVQIIKEYFVTADNEKQKRKILAEEKFDYDVVISGKGPAGLSAAFALLKTGKNILLISDRDDDFVRVQKIRIDCYAAKKLLAMHNSSLKKEEKIYQILQEAAHKNIGEYCYIAIKDLERYLAGCINELQEEKSEKTGKLKTLHNTKITSVDLEKGLAQLDSGEREISFRDLVCADGASHSTANLLKKADESPMFNYIPVNISANLPSCHVAGYLEIKATSGLELDLSEIGKRNLIIKLEDNLSAYCMLDFVSWEKSGHKSIKCYVIAELSQQEYDYLTAEKDQNLLREKIMPFFHYWLAEFLIKYREELEINIVKPSEKHGAAKDKMKCVLFQSNTKIADRPYVVSDSGHYAVLFGDAFGANDYRLGNGVLNFLSELEIMSKFLCDQLSSEKLKRAYEAIKDDHINRLKKQSIIKSQRAKVEFRSEFFLIKNPKDKCVVIDNDHRPKDDQLSEDKSQFFAPRLSSSSND